VQPIWVVRRQDDEVQINLFVFEGTLRKMSLDYWYNIPQTKKNTYWNKTWFKIYIIIVLRNLDLVHGGNFHRLNPLI
jgi:hypothetical protein